jgi:hypothetical protein
VDHMQAVAAATIDLPWLIADPRRTFNGCSLEEWLRVLAEGSDPRVLRDARDEDEGVVGGEDVVLT